MSQRATEDILSALHGKFAKVLGEKLDQARIQQDQKGLAATLNVVRQFLKDNGIEAVPDTNGEDAFSNLVKQTLGDSAALPYSSAHMDKPN